MALNLIGTIAAITDAVAASLVSGTTQTRDAVDARVRVVAGDEIAGAVEDALADTSAIVDAVVDRVVDENLVGVAEDAAADVVEEHEWSVRADGVWAGGKPTFTIGDNLGRNALSVDDDGNVGIVGAKIKHLPEASGYSFVVTDRNDRIGSGVLLDGSGTGGTGGTGEVHVIVGAGQSNMAGRGAPFGEPYDYPNPRVLTYQTRDKTIVPVAGFAQGPEEQASEGFSPLVAFGESYARAHPGVTVLLVQTAVGGTGFITEAPRNWDVAQTGNLYTQMFTLVAEAVAAIGGTPKIAAMLWHQGEADTSTLTDTEWLDHFTALVDGARAQWGDIPVIMGEMNPDGWSSTNGREARSIAQASMQARREKVVFVRAKPNMSRRSDDLTHFNRWGAKTLGQDMFAALEFAEASRDALTPQPPLTVEARTSGASTIIEWGLPGCRATAYQVRVTGPAGVTTHDVGPYRKLTVPGRASSVEVRTNTASGWSLWSAVVDVVSAAPYSTGVVDLASTVPADQGWNAGVIAQAIRSNDSVTVTVRALARATAGSGYQTAAVLPANMRPPFPVYGRTFRGVPYQILTNGEIQLSSPGVATDYISADFTTTATES